MGKRKGARRGVAASANGTEAATPDFVTRGANSIKTINTWDDIEHNSEDEFHEQRDKVLLHDFDQHPGDEDEDDEEEVFNLGTESGDHDEEDGEDEEDEGEEEEEGEQTEFFSDDEDKPTKEDEDLYKKGWGRNKLAYYDGDEVQSDQDEVKEEEAEVIRLQKEHVAKLGEEDFLDDAGDSLGAMDASERAGRSCALVYSGPRDLSELEVELETEVIPKPPLDDLPREKLLDILSSEAPEVCDMLSDFEGMLGTAVSELAPLLSRPTDQSLLVDFVQVKYHVLLSYLTNVAFYLHLRASGMLNPQDHPVVETLITTREKLDKLLKLERNFPANIATLLELELDALEADSYNAQRKLEQDGVAKLEQEPEKRKEKGVEMQRRSEENKAEPKKVRRQKQKSKRESSPVFNGIVEEEFVPLGKAKSKKRRRDANDDDFWDPSALDALDAEDKVQRKRSLRHHALRLVAQSDRRESKGAQISGDNDLPRKSRQRRQDAKGVPQPGPGVAELDGEDPEEAPSLDPEDHRKEMDLGDDEGERYYNLIKGQSAEKWKKIDLEKEAAAAARLIRIEEPVLETGTKRLADYKILKNKGLTRYHKKENRNPRVKNKNRYERKMKKLSSFGRRGQIGQAGEASGSYGGERTGIRTGIAKSVKLQ